MNNKQKNALYLIAIIAIVVMVVGVIAVVAVPAISAKIKAAKGQSVSEKLVGQWFYDYNGGNGGEWVTFNSDGSYTLYQEVTAADGTSVYQDSSSIGTATYEVPDEHTLRVHVTVMGSTVDQDIEIELKDDSTLILDGNTYIKQEQGHGYFETPTPAPGNEDAASAADAPAADQ